MKITIFYRGIFW